MISNISISNGMYRHIRNYVEIEKIQQHVSYGSGERIVIQIRNTNLKSTAKAEIRFIIYIPLLSESEIDLLRHKEIDSQIKSAMEKTIELPDNLEIFYKRYSGEESPAYNENLKESFSIVRYKIDIKEEEND